MTLAAGHPDRGSCRFSAAKVRFWVTMCPRTVPVSTASASLNSPLSGSHRAALTALAAPCAAGGQPIARTRPRPAAAASWRTLRTVNQVSWVKSPYLMCPPNGLTAFGTRATNRPPGRSARATASNVPSTSGFVRCSSRSVAVTAASSPGRSHSSSR